MKLNDITPAHRRSAPVPPVQENTIDLGVLLMALWRGKLIILLAMVLAIVIGGVQAFVLAVPTYRSSTVIMLESREEQVVELGDVIGGLGSDSTVVNSELQILRSRALLGKVVDALALTEDPEFNPTLRDPSLVAQARNAVSDLLSSDGPRGPVGEKAQWEMAIDALLQAVSVRNIPQSLVFEVTAETTAREKSVAISDTLVALYIQGQLEAKFQAVEQATSWLAGRVAELQVSLEAAESRVKTFRASTSLINEEALARLEIQLKETRDRIEAGDEALAAAQTYLQQLQGAQTPAEQVAVSDDTQLRNLLSRINVTVVAQAFEARYAQIVARAEADVMRLETQDASLRTSAESLAVDIEQQSQDQITLQQLTREAEASRLLYEYFLSRLKETSAQEGIQQADSRVISPARLPTQAATPRRSFILVMSAILGLMAGVALVLLREALHRTFRSADQLESFTGYGVIGQVPRIPVRRRKSAIRYLKDKPTSAVAEAVRNLRTSVMLSDANAPPKVILVCSALPSEGKTTTSMSLAMNFAAQGKKTLLVEGDLRRRIFGQYLDAGKTEGLVSLMQGRSRLEDSVVKNDPLLGADVLLADKSETNAADLFASQDFGHLVAALREAYDVVIIDSAPVLIAPDARLIAQHVDATALVVLWNQTTKTQVSAALREFESVGRHVTGLVLNRISKKGMSQYGYGAYSAYGSKYYQN